MELSHDLPHALHECPDCGLFQTVDGLRPGQVAACLRCSAVLRRRRRDSLTTVFAVSLAGLLVFMVAAAEPLVTFRLTGQERQATLLDLPLAFDAQHMDLLAVVMLATTILAPFLRLLLTVLVLGGLRLDVSRRALALMARGREWLKPWAMTEVFLLGLFVAYSRLEALAQVQVGVALYALIGLMLLTAWSDFWMDEHAMWEAIGARGPALPPARTGRRLGCDACGLVSQGNDGDACPRCETRLRHRKPNPIGRSWALLLTAAILYVPANLYPVLTVIRLGSGHPSTILGGVVELVEYRMWPLALLVFFASIVVPTMKLVGLAALLVLTQRGSPSRLEDRTRLFRIVDVIGRWSMIDVFMVAVLTALVRMGALASVTPGYGAMAFCAVVVLTMLAALSFDPRLMWDRAEEAEEPRPADQVGTVTA